MRSVRLVVTACVLACVLGGLGATSTTAVAAEKALWGPLTLPSGASAFPTYRDLGVDTLQLPVDWAAAAPARPANPGNPADSAYHWPAELDRGVSTARAFGIDVALLVSGSPGWANGGQSSIHAPNAGDYAAFVAAASRRYPSVRRWMVWGEPNRDDRFLPNAVDSPVGPRAYASILDAAYAALKAVSQSNIVIGGMTWTGGTVKPAQFLRFMRLPSGRPPRLDWYGHNPFPFRFPNLRELHISNGWRDMSDMDLFSDEVKRVYGPTARLWLSEFLVLSDRPSREFEQAISRQGQAQWLTAAFDAADSLPSIGGMGWLGLLDEPEQPGSSNYGLMTASGARKPSYEAFRVAPSVRFRPGVRVAKRVRRRAFAERGLRLLVRPRLYGRVTAELRTSRNRRMARTARSGRAGTLRSLRLPRRRLRRGRYTLVIRAFRAESVRRRVSIR